MILPMKLLILWSLQSEKANKRRKTVGGFVAVPVSVGDEESKMEGGERTDTKVMNEILNPHIDSYEDSSKPFLKSYEESFLDEDNITDIEGEMYFEENTNSYHGRRFSGRRFR